MIGQLFFNPLESLVNNLKALSVQISTFIRIYRSSKPFIVFGGRSIHHLASGGIRGGELRGTLNGITKGSLAYIPMFSATKQDEWT